MSERERIVDWLGENYRMDSKPDPEDKVAVVELAEGDSYVSFHRTLDAGLHYMNTNENLDRIGDTCEVYELDTGAEHEFRKQWHYGGRKPFASEWD